MAAEIQRQLPSGKQADCGKNTPRQQGQMISLAQIIKPTAKKIAQSAAQANTDIAYADIKTEGTRMGKMRHQNINHWAAD